MLEPLKRDKVWMKTIEQYLNRHYWQAASFYQIFELGPKGEVLGLIEGFEVYPIAEQVEIIGLIASNGKGLTLVHFTDFRVKSKYNVLKTLINLKSNCLKGDVFSVDVAKQILEKSLIEANDEAYHWMAMDLETQKCLHERDFVEKLDGYGEIGVAICLAAEVEFKQMLPFLIEVEKNFNRNPLSVNQLKKKMNDRSSLDAYLLVLYREQVVGQGLLEYRLPEHQLIGGIYVIEAFRHKGIGDLITEALCQVVYEKETLPALTVEKNNTIALKLYEHVGFKTMGDLKTSYIKMR